jgi:very-short-patch-repair endonuclease
MLRGRAVGDAKFVRQHPIGRYVADFVCREQMLIVEADGGQHSESKSDRQRTAFLNARGYSVLRFWNNDILQNPEGCWIVLTAVLDGNPSPDLRFAPATLSPEARGEQAANFAKDEC